MRTRINNFWRPAYEAFACATWLGVAAVVYAMAQRGVLAPQLLTWTAYGMIAAGACRFVQAWRLWEGKARLSLVRPIHMSPGAIRRFAKRKSRTWLGRGFLWDASHSQQLRDLSAVDEDELKPPGWFKALCYALGKAHRRDMHGRAHFHGLGFKRERHITVAANDLSSHTALIGTTGAGKGRCLELFIQAAIARGESVVIIDPKLDKGMRDRAYSELLHQGRPEAFHFFHPAFPKASVRVNPMRNFASPTQLADRIASLMPGGGEAEGFRRYAWKVVNSVVQGLIQAGERPNLVKIRRYVVGGVDELLRRAGERFFEQIEAHYPSWRLEVERLQRKCQGAPRKLPPEEAYIEAIRLYYRHTVREERENEAMEGLLGIYEHNREHYGKMIATLEPILEALNAGSLRELLSPDYDDPDDPRPILDLAKVCRKGEVVYMALDSLSNPTVGSMIGALMLADLTAVAGSRYNFDSEDPIPVNVFVDELSEVASELFITTINKSRAALFRVTFAGQTLADLEVRFGREAYAYQILGNANNVIGMRSRDPQTQQYLSDNIGTTRTSISDFHHSTSTRTDESDIDFERNTAVRFSHTDGQARIEPPAFGKLPDLEAIATLVDGRTVKLKIPFNPVPPDERYPQRNFL